MQDRTRGGYHVCTGSCHSGPLQLHARGHAALGALLHILLSDLGADGLLSYTSSCYLLYMKRDAVMTA
jgi:hypothetical protein